MLRELCEFSLCVEESLKECGEREAARGEGAFRKSEAVPREGGSLTIRWRESKNCSLLSFSWSKVKLWLKSETTKQKIVIVKK